VVNDEREGDKGNKKKFNSLPSCLAGAIELEKTDACESASLR